MSCTLRNHKGIFKVYNATTNDFFGYFPSKLAYDFLTTTYRQNAATITLPSVDVDSLLTPFCANASIHTDISEVDVLVYLSGQNNKDTVNQKNPTEANFTDLNVGFVQVGPDETYPVSGACQKFGSPAQIFTYPSNDNTWNNSLPPLETCFLTLDPCTLEVFPNWVNPDKTQLFNLTWVTLNQTDGTFPDQYNMMFTQDPESGSVEGIPIDGLDKHDVFLPLRIYFEPFESSSLSSSAPGSSSTPASSPYTAASHHPNIGAIAGGVTGGAILFLLCLLLILRARKRSRLSRLDPEVSDKDREIQRDQSKETYGSNNNASVAPAGVKELLSTTKTQQGDAQSPRPSSDIWITFCKFEGGKLIKQRRILGTVQYIAISHIWAEATWHRGVPGLECDVLASTQKINFIVQQLPALVGSDLFWMDILCVNQRNSEERINVVRHIPAIYRGAIKTIVVRESGGLQQCCTDAIGDFDDWMKEGAQKFAHHVSSQNLGHMNMTESWFDRLWPLQETVLSDRLQFTVCAGGNNRDLGTIRSFDDFYNRNISTRRIIDNFYCAAQAWSMYGLDDTGEESERTAFIKAFLSNGNVKRRTVGLDRARPRTLTNDFRIHSNSFRITSEPRDFFLAIMPQYGWYSPPSDVRAMSFGQLYVNCFLQAQAAGYGFIPNMTNGLVGIASDSHESRLPCGAFPSPTSLGDFIKLFGSLKDGNDGSIGAIVGKTELHVPDLSDMEGTLQIIEHSMRLTETNWAFAHRGDLSTHGMWPETGPHDLELELSEVQFYRRNSAFFSSLSEGDQQSYATREATLTTKIAEQRSRPEFYEIEAMKTLNAMYVGLLEHDVSARSDWYSFRRELVERDPLFYQQAMLNLAALITCDLPVSTLDWSKSVLSPMLAELNGEQLLVLVSKASLADWFEGREYVCVQRGAMVGVTGTNLVLVNSSDGCIVGRFPNILHGAESTREAVDDKLRRLSPAILVLDSSWKKPMDPPFMILHKGSGANVNDYLNTKWRE